MANYGNKVYGLRELRVGIGANNLAFPISQKLTAKPVIDSAKLEGDDRIQASITIITGYTLALTAGGVPQDVIALIMGTTVVQTGGAGSFVNTLTIDINHPLPYFSLYGRGIGDSADDMWYYFPKVKVTDLTGDFSGKTFMVSTCTMDALPDQNGVLMKLISHQAALALPVDAPSYPAA